MNEIRKLKKLARKLERRYEEAMRVKACMGQGSIVTAERILKKAKVIARRLGFLLKVYS